MLARFDAEADDGFLAERLGGFQPVQALDQHEPRAVRTHKDWCLLADVEHAGGDFVHALLHERGPAFDRHYRRP
jgi:hypothetical protein